MAETDLYLPVKKFLEAQGYEVKGEVRECDIFAVRGDEPPVIVELKTVFNLQLLLQGIDRQGVTDAVYLAVKPPGRRQHHDSINLCRRLGLGLLAVADGRVVPLADPAPYQPRKNAGRKAMLLKEFSQRAGDPDPGGSARRPMMTAYRQDALRCARAIGGGPAKVADIRAQAKVKRAGAILTGDVYGWFARRERGVYALTPKGDAALELFADALGGL